MKQARPAAPRLRAASTDRWRCARAASAPPGRGNRRSCRACRPRGRARCRDAHSAATSAMATVRCKPPRIGRVVVGLGMDRVVMVAGIGRIDGDERQRRADRARPLGEAGLAAPPRPAPPAGNTSGMPCCVHGDQARPLRWSSAGRGACGRAPTGGRGRVRHELGRDQLARLRAMVVAGRTGAQRAPSCRPARCGRRRPWRCGTRRASGRCGSAACE